MNKAHTDHQEQHLLTMGEVARMLDVSARRVDQLVAAGRLRPARTPRGFKVFATQEIEMLLIERLAKKLARPRGFPSRRAK